MRYHIDIHGEAARCRAPEGECPKNAEHYASVREAQEAYEAQNHDDMFGSLHKSASPSTDPFQETACPDGWIDLYHRTTPTNRDAIHRSGQPFSKENTDEMYFSTSATSDVGGYGDAVVAIRVPQDIAEIDDEFPDGEEHYRVATTDIEVDHIRKQCGNCQVFTQSVSEHDCPYDSWDDQQQKWRESLTDDEAEAWDIYSGVLHDDLNYKLRTGGTLNKEEQYMVTHMDSSFARAPESHEPHVVYRGIQLSPDETHTWVHDYVKDDGTVDFPGYTSTTFDSHQAEYFARNEFGRQEMFFVLQTRKGITHGQHQVDPEQELTLPRGTTFHYVGTDEWTDNKGSKHPCIILEEP